MKKLWLILILPLLTQCSSSSSRASSATLPTLTSPGRAQAWGAPQIEKTANGYVSTYVNPANPKEKFRILGSTKMMPYFVYPPNIKGTSTQPKKPQLWNKALVQQSTVKWYQSSFSTPEKAAEFRTLGITLKDQSGGSGQYRFEAEGTKNQMQTWLTELRFGQ